MSLESQCHHILLLLPRKSGVADLLIFDGPCDVSYYFYYRRDQNALKIKSRHSTNACLWQGVLRERSELLKKMHGCLILSIHVDKWTLAYLCSALHLQKSNLSPNGWNVVFEKPIFFLGDSTKESDICAQAHTYTTCCRTCKDIG